MKFSLSILLLFFCARAVSQTYSISGTVLDEKNISFNSAEIKLTSKDSIKLTTTTDKDGKFLIKQVTPGIYYLTISAHGYENYMDSIHMGKAPLGVGVIHLTPAIHMLDEVKIVDKVAAMVQKDDTVEFNSAAYKVNPDADAADLVRKMPSIEVNGKNVTAQGEGVVKVLVDGMPFFGTDPYGSLTNLPAEIIDKVQVYNEKSDQEQFTGFSEGNTSKTINIITKADKRNGIFGKAYGGYGRDNSDDGKYGAGATLNGFDGAHRITLTGQTNNVNVQNFTAPASGGGGGGGGNTNTNAGGLNYTDKWGVKTDIAGSYFFDQTNTTITSMLRKTYILPADSGQVYNQNSPSTNQNYSHRFNLRLNYKADSMNSVLWQPTFSFNKNSGTSQIQAGTTEETDPINQTNSNNITKNTGYTFGNDILLRHRFLKKGRTFSADINANNNNTDNTARRTSQNIYYNSIALSDSLNQQSLQNQNTWTATGNATYTEPAGEHGLFKLSYIISYLPSRSGNNTYDYSYATNSYSLPDSLYSSSFYGKNISHKAGVSYQFHIRKFEASAGLNYELSGLRNDQTLPVSYTLSRNFQNLLPVASFHYKFSKTKNLQANYNTSTQAPAVSQLQNVVNNTNPLFLTTGNPALLQPYQHTLTLRYNAMGRDAKSSFSASLTGNYTHDGITSNSIVAANDTFVTSEHILLPAGSQLAMPENISGNSALNANLSYGMPLTAIKCNIKFNLNTGISHSPSIINNVVNEQNNKNGGFGVSLSSNISENIDFLLSSNTNITSSANSLNTQINTTYLNETSRASINLIFWKGFVFNTNISYQTNSGLSAGYNQDYALWNASVGKKILKKHLGDIRLVVNDILNQNNNIQHTVTDTYVQDARSNILQRYFLVVFIYKLRDFKK